MMHFETIWNEAESISKSFSSLSRKEILGKLRKALDDLSDSDSIAELNQSFGDMLFEMCAFCAHLEDKKGLVINSAAALMQVNAQRRAQLITEKQPIPD